MELQQESAQLQKEDADLETQIVDHKLQLNANKNSNSTTSIEQEMKMDIGHATKFFHIFMSPSVSVEAFMVDKPTFLYDSPECYDDGQQNYGIMAELHHTIPEKYLTYLKKHELLVKQVSSSVLLECHYPLIEFHLSVPFMLIHWALFCSGAAQKQCKQHFQPIWRHL